MKKGNRKEREERGREGELLQKELILSRDYRLGWGEHWCFLFSLSLMRQGLVL